MSAWVTTPVGTRYHHGKVIEWWAGPTGLLLTGSANCTRPALLRAMTEPGGNCELVLLQQIGKSLLASVEANDCDLDDADLRVRTGDDDERPAAPPLRVLSVRLIRGRIEVTVVVTSGAPPHHLVKELEGKIVSHFSPRPVVGPVSAGEGFPSRRRVRSGWLWCAAGSPAGEAGIPERPGPGRDALAAGGFDTRRYSAIGITNPPVSSPAYRAGLAGEDSTAVVERCQRC